ncbi:hypothetical protein [Pigmentibacter ruber]|uniref:hypothetical protein n=1 Tax=Pigmentibacter ruber TaxID=2683196 RepID=UPI00131A8F51|nr:hypothetical protein [Pigmentibacter ruber]
MKKYGKILTYLSSLAVISQATATDNNATCTEDITNLKKQVTLLQNGLHNLNAFRVVGRDSVFNELKTKLETLTMNYELLERRVDSLAKNDNFTLSNPCDQWSRMPGVTKLEFTNTDYFVGTTSYHSIPIDTTTNYNAYAVCFYDDVKYKGGNKSKIFINNKRSYDVIPNSNYENFSCAGGAGTEISSGSYLSIVKQNVTFDSKYLERTTDIRSCYHMYSGLRGPACKKDQVTTEKNNEKLKINPNAISYYKNLNNYSNYIFLNDPYRYFKSSSISKQGSSNGEKFNIKSVKRLGNFTVEQVAINNFSYFDQHSSYDEFSDVDFQVELPKKCLEKFKANSYSIINRSSENISLDYSQIGYLETGSSNNIDLKIYVDKYSSKLNVYLVPLKY